MAEFTVIELQESLNYDTNETKVFTWLERIEIHRTISALLGERLPKPFEFDLEAKIKKVSRLIQQENYEPINRKYYEEAGEIKII